MKSERSRSCLWEVEVVWGGSCLGGSWRKLFVELFVEVEVESLEVYKVESLEVVESLEGGVAGGHPCPSLFRLSS